MVTELLTKLAVSGIVLGGVLNFAGMQTWLERKQSALMQDRIGANRAYFTFPCRIMAPVNWVLRKLGSLGIINALADVIKLLTKEDIVPDTANKLLHTLAPFLSVFFAVLAFAAIPIGPPVQWGD